MFYSIQHLTKFHYAAPVSESVMEARMHPRSEGNQRCLTFHLAVSPRCRVFAYRDHVGNNIHHFDIPGQHSYLVIVAESLLDMQPSPEIPTSLGADAWAVADAQVKMGDYWEMLLPSEFAQPTPPLLELARELEVRRRDDPLSLLRELNQKLYDYFEYVPRSTKVDSPIDEAIASRQGVCQDFAHIMIAGAPVEDSLPLRQRIPLPPRPGPRPLGGGCDSRLGRGFPTSAGLGGLRSHQLSAGRRPPYSHRHRPRLCRRAAYPGNLPRTYSQRIVRGSAGDRFGRAS